VSAYEGVTLLKLKKLQILGFKSFCDRTELKFHGDGIAAIIGPNGCGKSNIADAISWVLGEQSAKTLRGSRMEDVIFAGTRDRNPTGMAEVCLTLIDPEIYGGPDTNAPTEIEIQDDLPAEGIECEENWDEAKIRRRKFNQHQHHAGEISVTRRLFRSGDSEYLLNGKLCRLRDIQDIFMGTGLGPESYALIEQGRIGQILSSKPTDRRAIIEEAAGITKFKTKQAARRSASGRRKAEPESRINDIFDEVTRQMNSLKRQASQGRALRQAARRDARQAAHRAGQQVRPTRSPKASSLDAQLNNSPTRSTFKTESVQRWTASTPSARSAATPSSAKARKIARSSTRSPSTCDRAAAPPHQRRALRRTRSLARPERKPRSPTLNSGSRALAGTGNRSRHQLAELSQC
jgi:chromosome segregation protein